VREETKIMEVKEEQLEKYSLTWENASSMIADLHGGSWRFMEVIAGCAIMVTCDPITAATQGPPRR
jgi:hypothetical protein